MNKTFFFTSLIISLSLYSCNDSEIPPSITNIDELFHISSDSDDCMVLGEEEEDPYNINNMRKALTSLKKSGIATNIEDLEPTHTYCRFLPQDENELESLYSDTTIAFFEFPLNVEIIENGSYYHDPSLPDSCITWQYAVIPKGKTMPSNIQREDIYDIYIPEEDKVISKSHSELSNDLLTESLILTGHKDEIILSKSRWQPSGVLKYHDNLKGNIPLVGIQVHARNWTHNKQCLTDKEGRFAMGHFSCRVQYLIKWQRSKYDIRTYNFFQAHYAKEGSKTKEPWNYVFLSGKQLMLAVISQAANKMIYDNNCGLQRPQEHVYIKYAENGKGSEFHNNTDWTIENNIRADGLNDDKTNHKTTYEMFRSVCHEFGHYIHKDYMGEKEYKKVSKIIRESWAVAVAYSEVLDYYSTYLTNHHFYLSLQNSNNNDMRKIHKQFWDYKTDDNNYTPLLIDLIDNYNQRSVFKNTNYVNDRISGYTISEIQNKLLKNSYDITSLKTKLKNLKLHNETDSDIDLLFQYY